MPARNNPFYRYRNPSVGYGMEGLAAAMFPGAGGATPVQQSQITENQAQASAAQALAGYRGEQTRGERDVNNAMVSAPSAIAELLLSGGVLQSDPMRTNPDYKAPTPIDFASILTNPAQINQPITSPMLPGATAQDKMAAAIQEAAIRKIRLDDLLKAAGITGFTQRAAGQNPDSALAYAPFVGVSPNQNTAFTTTRQDAISARDASEALSQAQAVARIQQQGATDRANNRPVSAGSNVDVILSPAQGQLLGIEPDGEGRYIVRGRSTVGAGQVQQPGSAGGETVQGRERAMAPVRVGNNTDVIVTPEQGKALGLTPNADGQYVIRGRATVGTGQDQMPGTAGGEAARGRERAPAGRAGTSSKQTTEKLPPAVPKAAIERMQARIREGLKADGITADDASVLGLASAAGTSWQSSRNPDAAADDVLQRLRAGQAVNGVSVNKSNRSIAGVPIPGTERKSTTRAAPGALSAVEVQQAREKAAEAIARGAPRDAVLNRLRQNGIDTKGL